MKRSILAVLLMLLMSAAFPLQAQRQTSVPTKQRSAKPTAKMAAPGTGKKSPPANPAPAKVSTGKARKAPGLATKALETTPVSATNITKKLTQQPAPKVIDIP